jgi:hypothetical protein
MCYAEVMYKGYEIEKICTGKIGSEIRRPEMEEVQGK